MNADCFLNTLSHEGIELYCGVPDSLLKAFCACLAANVPPERNIISANEGNALATSAGHFLATGKPAVVYMQNSGLGNIVNPLLSLNDEAVYNIPALMIIGWRGEPGVKDEPQHITQGRLTLPLLETMGIEYEVLSDERQVPAAMDYMRKTHKPFAFIVKQGTFEAYSFQQPKPKYELSRELAIRTLIRQLDEKDVVVSTTGMISRELYESRITHEKDFLTVGSMGHASSIAFGIALSKPARKVFCLDGDGAFLMHMGAAAVIASRNLPNLRHIIINNEAHDSVGGQPTVMGGVKIVNLLKSCGYQQVYEACSVEEIEKNWHDFSSSAQQTALVIYVKSGARKDLGRPKESPLENKSAFMNFLNTY